MDERRRQIITGIAAAAGAALLDGFGILRASAEAQSAAKIVAHKPSRKLEDYPHITDTIPSKDMELYFPLIVDACADPEADYLSKIPFLIELEVAKIWSESRFEWDALSFAGAAGLQQIMEHTARDFGLTIARTAEIDTLNSSISDYRELRSEMFAKQQELHGLVESGTGDITKDRIDKINACRSKLVELKINRSKAYRKLKEAKGAYVSKINGMNKAQRSNTDARFVPELLIPAGVKHIVRDIMECKDFFGGPVEMNVWRGIAAYNAGLQKVKTWEGLPFIEETVHFTRNVVSDLTRALEMKHAYSTKDATLIAKTKMRIRLKESYHVYAVKEGDNFYNIVRKKLMTPYGISYSEALNYIRDSKGNKIDTGDMSIILPGQQFRIYSPR
ncbi:MAG: lytic transglycosylase domain-containing protein [Syntrophaceae bacterium]|nr:lytic transglycosylase domain-containing protein [Syntrophaceae bacterium]